MGQAGYPSDLIHRRKIYDYGVSNGNHTQNRADRREMFRLFREVFGIVDCKQSSETRDADAVYVQKVHSISSWITWV